MKIILCKHGITGPEPLKWRLVRYFYVQLKNDITSRFFHFLLASFALWHTNQKNLDEDYWLLLCLVYKPDARS